MSKIMNSFCTTIGDNKIPVTVHFDYFPGQTAILNPPDLAQEGFLPHIQITAVTVTVIDEIVLMPFELIMRNTEFIQQLNDTCLSQLEVEVWKYIKAQRKQPIT